MFNNKKKLKFKRRTYNKFLPKDIKYVDYKDTELLGKFVNNHGKIIPAAISGLSAHQQRVVSRAIKRARQMALMPYAIERVRR